jgi:BirA family biotin operon repressor/biotin-[acetyl-CoA-carboxylase] ligase
MFDLLALDACLAGTIFAGNVHYSEVTQSTNTDALTAARAHAPHGSVYLSDEQRAGRGRGRNGWHSTAGEGLYVSVLLRPALPAARMPLLPLAAGLAAAAAIREVTGLEIDIRWPNDLLLGPRKAGGILVEAKAEARANGVEFAVAGIGINVHQRSFPWGLSTPPTSLDLETGRTIPRQPLLLALLKALEREAEALHDPAGAATIPRRVQQSSTWIGGQLVQVHGPQACTGVTSGLDENGFLRVRTDQGMVTVHTGGLRALPVPPEEVI